MGLPARTLYETLLPGELSLLRLLPQTGRTHQLRLHLSAVGHPLAGDWLYGTEDPALIPRPALILADEPTGNLDTRNSGEVIALLKEASRKYAQTIVMITHSRSIAQTADRVLQVSDGVLTDFGRCAE